MYMIFQSFIIRNLSVSDSKIDSKIIARRNEEQDNYNKDKKFLDKSKHEREEELTKRKEERDGRNHLFSMWHPL